MGVHQVHRSARLTLGLQRNLLTGDGRPECSARPALRGPRAWSMSWLIQALTLGLAFAFSSALGRRRRMVMVFNVPHGVYHT